MSVTLLKYSYSVSPGYKKTEFIQCLKNFWETSQGHPNRVLKWRLRRRPQDLNFQHIQGTLSLYYFPSYSPNVFCSLLLLEKHPVNIVKHPEKTSAGWRSWEIPSTSILNLLYKIHFHCIIFNFISQNMCLKH